MALVTSADPIATAQCPKCKKLVKCYTLGGITYGYDPYLDFYHEECGTEWRYYIAQGQSIMPIPKPMSVREMMGEERWQEQRWKDHLKGFAIELFETLKACVDEKPEAKDRASDLIKRIGEVG